MTSRRTALSALAGATLAGQNRRPNIVLLFADDLGYGELGFQGNHEIPTPHLDSLARNGVRFTNGYASAPFCCPSRAGLMTGRYQTRFGHELNAIGTQNNAPGVGLPLSETTLANRLQSIGYKTGLFGKWHLGGRPEYHPQQRGFDDFYGFLHEGHFYYPPPYRGGATRLRTNEPPYDDNNPVLRDRTPIVEPEYLTDALAREAVSFIDRRKADPFFLHLAFNAIHSPMQAPVTLVRQFDFIRDEQRRLFAAMLHSMDQAVGRVLTKLRTENLERDTLIFFLSDNGGPTAELTSSNAPLRGGKGQLFEGGIRVPFCLQWKGRIAAGRVVDAPVSALDICPTAVAAAGGRLPEPLDGVNLLPFLDSATSAPPHRELFWRYGPNLALRQENWKLVRQAELRNKANSDQLFDLAADPSESRDLAATLPAVTARLRASRDALDRQMVAPLWGRR